MEEYYTLWKPILCGDVFCSTSITLAFMMKWIEDKNIYPIFNELAISLAKLKNTLYNKYICKISDDFTKFQLMLMFYDVELSEDQYDCYNITYDKTRNMIGIFNYNGLIRFSNFYNDEEILMYDDEDINFLIGFYSTAIGSANEIISLYLKLRCIEHMCCSIPEIDGSLGLFNIDYFKQANRHKFQKCFTDLPYRNIQCFLSPHAKSVPVCNSNV